MEISDDLYLVVGATSGCGYHIVRELLSRNKKVRIIVRDYDKAIKLFADVWEKIESAYVVDFTKEHWEKDILYACTDKSNEKIDYVISLLAATNKNDVDIYLYNFEINRRLISFFQKYSQLKNFVFISSFYSENPKDRLAIKLNKLRPNCLGCKNLVEVYLRLSGLKYTIIKPGKLEGFKDSKASFFEIKQGDRNSGFVERATVGKSVADLLELNKNEITFEILTNQKESLNKPYVNIFNEFEFENEKKENFIIHNHRGIVLFDKNIKFCLYTLFTGIILKYFAYRIHRFKIRKLLK